MDTVKKNLISLYRSLGFRIAVGVGLILLVSYVVFTVLAIGVHKRFFLQQMISEAETLSQAVVNATNHSMLVNDQELTKTIVKDLGMPSEISGIRIYNHGGVIRYASDPQAVGQRVDKNAAACFACHAQDEASTSVQTDQRVRFYESSAGHRLLGMITPIYNSPSCYTAACHAHPREKRVLGVIDVSMSLKDYDRHVSETIRSIVILGIATGIAVIATMVLFVVLRVNRPVGRLLEAVRKVALGAKDENVPVTGRDELGELGRAFNLMSAKVARRTTELERSREEYRTLFEQVPCFISVIAPDFTIVRQNSKMREYFKGTVGMKCHEVYKKQHEKCIECPIERTFRTGQRYEREECGLTMAGEQANYLSYTVPIRNDNGEVVYAMVIAMDIGERVRLRKQLQASIDFQTNLIEQSIHGIVATDEVGRINIFNQAAENIMGYSSTETLGSRRIEQFLPGQFVEMIHRSLRGEQVEPRRLVAQEATISSREGESIPVRFSGFLLSDDEGELAGSVGFYQDLRTVKRLEREKAEAARLAVVGQTVAGLAHGIKNVLQGLEGGLFVVETAIDDNDDQLLDKGWNMVRNNINRVSALVKDLLNYSRARTPEFELIDPNGLAEEVCSLYEMRAQENHVRLTRDFEWDVEKVFMDQRGIHTCLANLVSNAIDAFTGDNETKDREVIVRTRKREGGGITFEVADNGQGMDEKTKAKVFSSFFSTKGSRGTGLGLLVTSKIVQEHEGEISYESEPGVGTTFTIHLPQGDDPERGNGEAHQEEGSSDDARDASESSSS